MSPQTAQIPRPHGQPGFQREADGWLFGCWAYTGSWPVHGRLAGESGEIYGKFDGETVTNALGTLVWRGYFSADKVPESSTGWLFEQSPSGPPSIQDGYNPQDEAVEQLKAVLVYLEGPEGHAGAEGQARPDLSEIIALEARIRVAQLEADIPALERLISTELLFTGPDGQLWNKSQDLEAHRSGRVRFRAHVPEELRIRVLGADAAVSALRARLGIEVAGTLTEGTYRYTRVWAREADGHWRVAAGQVSAVQ